MNTNDAAIVTSTLNSAAIQVSTIVNNVIVVRGNNEGDDGSAGVREPRRPLAPLTPLAAAR